MKLKTFEVKLYRKVVFDWTFKTEECLIRVFLGITSVGTFFEYISSNVLELQKDIFGPLFDIKTVKSSNFATKQLKNKFASSIV